MVYQCLETQFRFGLIQMRTLTERDMLDLLLGAGILGCGGGGNAQSGLKLIKAICGSGKQFTLVDPNEIPEDKHLCIIGQVGGGVEKEITEKLRPYLSLTEKKDHVEVLTSTVQKAASELESLMGVQFFTYVPSEIGPGNTVLPMYFAALQGKPAVDADACGRAKPEMSLSTTNIAGIPVSPMTMANTIGDVMVLKKALDDVRGEDIARYMSVISGGMVSVARAPSSASNYKRGIVPNSISRCIKLGSVVRTSKEKGRDPIESTLKSDSNCIRLFHGRTKSWTRKEAGGFMWGDVKVQGTGDFRKRGLQIWFKNEYLITWVNNRAYATCPDSITVVDSRSGEGLSAWTPNLKKQVGIEVDILGFKAHELWRTERGIGLFGPKHFGYNIKYVPVEKAAKRIG